MSSHVPSRSEAEPGQVPPEDDFHSSLRRHRPALEAPRPEFETALKAEFLAAASRAGRDAEEQVENGPAARGESWWPRLRVALPTAALLALALWAAWMIDNGGIHRSGSQVPSMAELRAANAQAWADVRTLAGEFAVAGGERHQEWVVRADRGVERYRLLRDAGSADTARWVVSDGETEWTVDDASGEVLASAPAPAAEELADRLRCAALALPAGIEGSVEADRLDGRPVYRVRPAETGPSAQIGTYWLDAADGLVYRIDAPDGRVLWQRIHLELNPVLEDGLFQPLNRTRIDAYWPAVNAAERPAAG